MHCGLCSTLGDTACFGCGRLCCAEHVGPFGLVVWSSDRQWVAVYQVDHMCSDCAGDVASTEEPWASVRAFRVEMLRRRGVARPVVARVGCVGGSPRRSPRGSARRGVTDG